MEDSQIPPKYAIHHMDTIQSKAPPIGRKERDKIAPPKDEITCKKGKCLKTKQDPMSIKNLSPFQKKQNQVQVKRCFPFQIGIEGRKDEKG